MATVPRYSDRQVQEGRLPGVRMRSTATPEAFGAGSARQVGQIGQVAQGAANEYIKFQDTVRRKKNQVWLAEAQAKLSDRYDHFIYGDQETPGVLSLKGNEAIEAVEGASETLDNHISEIAGEAPDTETGRQFRMKALSIRRSISSTISRHGANELNSLHINAAVGNAQKQTRLLSADYHRPSEALEQDFQELVVPSLVEAARLKGEDSRELVAQEKEAFYANIINQNMAEGNTEEATKRLKRWHDHLSPEARTRLTSAVRKKEIEIKAYQAADNYLDDLRYERKTHRQITDEIRQIEDLDLQKATRSAYNSWAGQWRQEQQIDREERTWGAITEIDSMKGDLSAQHRYVNSLPTDTQVQRAVKNAAQSRLREYARFQGMDMNTNPDAYVEMEDMILRGELNHPRQIRGHDLTAKIAASDIKSLEGMLGEVQQVQSEWLKRAYIRASGDDQVQSNSDYLEFVTRTRAHIQDVNRGGDFDYIQKKADEWFMEGDRERRWFGIPIRRKKEEYREAIGDDSWLPRIVRDSDARFDDEIALTRARAEEVKNLPTFQAWLDEAEGNEDMAVRMYWREYLNDYFGRTGE